MVGEKDIRTIISELCEPFGSDSVKVSDKNGKPYIPAEFYRERVDLVLLGNYSDDYTELEVIQINNSYTVKVKCTLNIFDDSGKVLLTKSCYGGADVIFPKESDKPKDLANTIASAEQDAFKRVCKRLGMGINDIASVKSSSPAQNTKEETLTVVLESDGELYNNNIYANVSVDGTIYKLVGWNNNGMIAGYKAETMKKCMKKGKSFNGIFTKKEYKGQMQLVLKSIAS